MTYAGETRTPNLDSISGTAAQAPKEPLLSVLSVAAGSTPALTASTRTNLGAPPPSSLPVPSPPSPPSSGPAPTQVLTHHTVSASGTSGLKMRAIHTEGIERVSPSGRSRVWGRGRESGGSCMTRRSEKMCGAAPGDRSVGARSKTWGAAGASSVGSAAWLAPRASAALAAVVDWERSRPLTPPAEVMRAHERHGGAKARKSPRNSTR